MLRYISLTAFTTCLSQQVETISLTTSCGQGISSRFTTIEDIEVEFAIMTNKIKQALIDSKVDVDALIEQLCTISAVSNKKVPLFDEDVFIRITSVDEFWKRLRRFWSIYDYDLLRYIIKITKCKKAKSILEEFLSRIDPSAIRDVDLVLHCRVDQRDGSLRPTLRIKVNAEKCTYVISQKVKKIVSEKFELKEYTLCFKGIKEGCVELLYYISKAVKSYLLQYITNINIMTEFSTLKIISIYIDDVEIASYRFQVCDPVVLVLVFTKITFKY